MLGVAAVNRDGRHRRGVADGLELFVKEGGDFVEEPGAAVARTAQEVQTLFRVARQCGLVQALHLLPILRPERPPSVRSVRTHVLSLWRRHASTAATDPVPRFVQLHMLAPGTRLGPYEVVAFVGEGGMGQVFKALDTRLDRSVAIKILPAALAADAVRRERFEREARSISRLEHPNICPLYDVGEHDGHLYLVMQFLDGETLAEKLRNGPLPIKQALEFGVQVAEALATAHRAEIVHRDLKPANIMVTRTGVRLLDFGLARSVQTTSGAMTIAGSGTGVKRGALTTEGTILGTLSYMAPEQIDGREVDTRADVFAFGAVLFEIVTGMKAFDGESPARVMSAILRDEPARVSSLAPVTPAALEQLIHACMAKDANDRWQNISDVARQLRHLRDMMSTGSSSGVMSRSGILPAGAAAATAATRARWRTWAVAAALVAVSAFAAAALARWLSNPEPSSPLQLRALILPPAGMFLTDTLALSPDGQRVAFVAADATGQRQLWMRPLAANTAQAIAGTADASDPFWSPIVSTSPSLPMAR